MSSTEHTPIPQGVDDPPQILLWGAHELMPLAIALVVGIVLGRAALLTVAGLILVYVYRRLSENRPDGYFVHATYWAGLYPTRAWTFPNPFERLYLP